MDGEERSARVIGTLEHVLKLEGFEVGGNAVSLVFERSPLEDLGHEMRVPFV